MKLHKELSAVGAEELCKDWCTPGKDVYHLYYGVYTEEMMEELRDAIMDYISTDLNYVNLMRVTGISTIYNVSKTTYPIITSQK